MYQMDEGFDRGKRYERFQYFEYSKHPANTPNDLKNYTIEFSEAFGVFGTSFRAERNSPLTCEQ